MFSAWQRGACREFWSVMERRRTADGRTVDRPLLYLGEINDAQQAVWTRTIAGFDLVPQQPQTLSLCRSLAIDWSPARKTDSMAAWCGKSCKFHG